MQIPNETFLGVVALIISNVGLWIREYWKGKNSNKTNGVLTETYKKVEEIEKIINDNNLKLTELKTEVSSMKTHCADTVSRFQGAITDQAQKIYDLERNKEDKKL